MNYDSATTVTDEVARDMKADIDSGAIAPDTRCRPSWAAEQYGVSRVTVCRAIALLRDQGSS